jgi:translation initiation factor IF-3
VTEEGEQLGIMKTSQALALALEHGLDLVEVSPLANPPVAKLIDFAKFRYQQQKAESRQKKNAKKTEIKTIWISMRISEHDMQIKAKKITEFLQEKNMVRVELRMRGREQAYADQGRRQLEAFLKMVAIPYKIEMPMKRMGGTFAVTIVAS